MPYPSQTDTIAAISTPYGTGGIAVIRVSGAQAISIADKLYRGKAPLSQAGSHTVCYGGIYEDGARLDEVLATVLRAPRTYTREDTVEISCHGGICCANQVLSAVLRAGARLAEPGEFTKRAYFNGRIDLTEAEAILGLIQAKTPRGCRAAVHQMGGALSDRIGRIRNSLLSLSAHVQVLCDYPDEGLEPLSDQAFALRLDHCRQALHALLAAADRGRIVRDGIDTVIAGRPNVGKSSLLNLLCGSERAIVTDIAGTTRDTLEESVTLGGLLLKLSDTAGIRDTDEAVEAIGVQRARERLGQAALILYLVDGSEPENPEDVQLLSTLPPQTTILLRNKADKGCALEKNAFPSFPHQLAFSAKTGQGLDKLEHLVTALFLEQDGLSSPDDAVLLSVRARAAAEQALSCVCDAQQGMADGFSPDTVVLDIEAAIGHLGEVDGKSVNEEVVDAMFHQFCVGK